ARLAEAAARRGHSAGRVALEGPQDDHSAPARRAAQERAGRAPVRAPGVHDPREGDRKSTRLNSSHVAISYAVFCLKKKKQKTLRLRGNQVDDGHREEVPAENERYQV